MVHETIDLYFMPTKSDWMRSFAFRSAVWLVVSVVAYGTIFAYSGWPSVLRDGVGIALVSALFIFFPFIAHTLSKFALRIIAPHRRYLDITADEDRFVVELGPRKLIHATTHEISYSTGKPKFWSRRVLGLPNNDVLFWRKWRSGLTIWFDSLPPIAVPCGFTPESKARWTCFLNNNHIPLRVKEPFLVVGPSPRDSGRLTTVSQSDSQRGNGVDAAEG